MNQNCFICNLPIGISARNCVKIFGDNSGLQSGKKLHDILSEVVETTISESSGQSSVVCKKCQKACTEYDSLQTRLQVIKNELQDSYKKTTLLRNSQANASPPKVLKEAKRIVLPASKLQPLPANYILGMGKLGQANMIPRIDTSGSMLSVMYKQSNNPKVVISSAALTKPTKIITSSPDSMPSSSKVTDSNIIVSSLMNLPSQNILTKKTKNPVMGYNVSLAKDFLSSAVLVKSDDMKVSIDALKKEIQLEDGLNETENNVEQPMEIDEDCSLAVVPVTTDANGKLVFEGDKIDLKSKSSSNFFDVGLLLEGDTETQSSDREEKFILDKLQILNENLDDDDDDDDDHSNDESQIELQVSGDEETANAIIAAAQEQGGAFIKVESGEMYRVKSVQSKTDEELDDSLHLSSIVEAQEGGLFKCLLCEKNKDKDPDYKPFIRDASATSAHVRSHHGARLYLCPLCGRAARRRRDHTRHIEEHALKNKPAANKSKLNSCVVCLKTYNSRTLLTEHMNTHTGSRPYSCDVCRKGFASKYTLQAHIKTHEDRPRPHKCPSCGKAFLTLQNLAQHEKTHSGIKEFVCKICNKAFATQHNLEVHCVVHTGRKHFVCSVCDKGFARRAEVKDHMRIHTGERPFTCDICGATFTQRSNLHSHKRATHYDDKRYHCAHCPKRFKRKRLLDYHIKAVHTGERPLKCEICKATFVYPEHYKKHIRIHSGERPYVCEVCGKSFNSRDNRNMHRFVHSDKKPYECLACGAGFMRKQLLYAHMNTTGHVAESIVVNQPKIITTVENIFDTTELELDENQLNVIEEDSAATKVYITEGDKKIVIQEAELNVLQDVEDSGFLTLHNFNGLIEANVEDKGDQTQLLTTDDKGNTMRLIQVQLPDGKNGWVAIDN